MKRTSQYFLCLTSLLAKIQNPRVTYAQGSDFFYRTSWYFFKPGAKYFDFTLPERHVQDNAVTYDASPAMVTGFQSCID